MNTNVLATLSIHSALVALAALTMGCASASDPDDPTSPATDEAAFTVGAVSRLEGTFFSQQVDTRAPAAIDARCWGSPIPAGVVCQNPPLPKIDLGTGSVAVRIRQYTPGSDRARADVRVVHPSFDGTQTVTRTFWSIDLQLGDGGYGPGHSWSARVTDGGLTYHMGLIFPWVGLHQAGELHNVNVRIEDESDTYLSMSTW